MQPWSTPDLSDITAVLTGVVQAALNAAVPSASNIKISNNSPDARTSDSYCHLTLYLLHVGRDPYWRNTPVAGPRGQPNSAQPLSLNLSYLLTAWHDTDFASEQRAMTIALQAIHSQPIVNTAIIQKDGLSQYLPNGEFTVSIEADTIEEMSRLWQSITVPIRLSALIKAGVVFIAPAIPTPPPPSLPPTVANLSVAPGAVSPPPATPPPPVLFAGGSVAMQPVLPATADPAQIVAGSGPLIAVGGTPLLVSGTALDAPDAATVSLAAAGGAPVDVSAWRQTPAQPGQLVLALPATYGGAASAVATPPPGLYSLGVGGSDTVPIAVAPRVDGVTYPPQLLPNAAGVYSIAGAGFVPGATLVALGALPLTPAAAAAAGQFTVSPTAITFMLPNPAPAKGSYPVLIQVNGIAAAPGWVVVVS
jgi:hypothetical protein